MTNTETKLQVYMPATMREQVHQAAEALRISESEWIRRSIDLALAANNEEIEQIYERHAQERRGGK